VTQERRSGPLFPLQGRYRWKKLALAHYRAWQRAYRQANRTAKLARLAVSGALSLAQVVEWLTLRQVRYQLGALPVLYALLETLQVRQIINRHCRSQAQIDHGTVALVLILNRLMYPLPLSQVADSQVMDFGFAHNTPSHKRKFKLALNALADGNLTGLYELWSGRMADQAPIQTNMSKLAHWLQTHGYRVQETLGVGDRAMLSDEIALAYDNHQLRYLAGLRCLKKEHKALLSQWPEAQFLAYPLTDAPTPRYWGRGCQVSFSHTGRSVSHKGLVVLAGSIRDQLRKERAQQFDELNQQLSDLRASLGQPRLRTVKAVQRRAKACLQASPVGHLMAVTVKTRPTGQVQLAWQIDSFSLWQAEQRDGRYLLVTNDWSLSHQEIFKLYRAKDGLEKRFHVCKADLKVSPVYLHRTSGSPQCCLSICWPCWLTASWNANCASRD